MDDQTTRASNVDATRASSVEDEPIVDATANAVTEPESHATTGGAAAAGAVTGGVIGLTGGPIGAAIGAVGGAIVGAAAERIMHNDDGNRDSAEVSGLDSGGASVRSPRESEE